MESGVVVVRCRWRESRASRRRASSWQRAASAASSRIRSLRWRWLARARAMHDRVGGGVVDCVDQGERRRPIADRGSGHCFAGVLARWRRCAPAVSSASNCTRTPQRARFVMQHAREHAQRGGADRAMAVTGPGLFAAGAADEHVTAGAAALGQQRQQVARGGEVRHTSLVERCAQFVRRLVEHAAALAFAASATTTPCDRPVEFAQRRRRARRCAVVGDRAWRRCVRSACAMQSPAVRATRRCRGDTAITGRPRVQRGADHAAPDGAGGAEDQKSGALFIVPVLGTFTPAGGMIPIAARQVVALHGAGHGEARTSSGMPTRKANHHDHQPGRAGAVSDGLRRSQRIRSATSTIRPIGRSGRRERGGCVDGGHGLGPMGMAHN